MLVAGSRLPRRRLVATSTLVLVLALAAGGCKNEQRGGAPLSEQPFVAAHRGDPSLPENTLEAFRSALDTGADYIETDLVASKDAVLVLRHDRALSPTTDVEDHPEFASRQRTKTVDGRPRSDWWVEDFTAAELATLTATVRDRAASGEYRIPTLTDVLTFAREEAVARGRRVGLLLETKKPALFARLGLDLELLLASALRAQALDRADAPIALQSFDTDSVRELAALLREPAVQLVANGHFWDREMTAEGLSDLHADGVDAVSVVDERLERDPSLIERAHAAGLTVEGWGFEPGENYERWIRAGLDGFVTDDVDAVLAARKDAS
jgi:glycerophosphoryl diester phosphodiesterase